MVAAIGSGDVFSKGRDFAAWLGLVPKQISTGDRRRPALTAPCARRVGTSAGRDEGTASPARTKELHKIKSD
jgi:transposase